MSEMQTNCEVFRERLDDYRRGDLDANTVAKVREHLSTCAECASELQGAEQLGRLLRESNAVLAQGNRPDLAAIAATARAKLVAEQHSSRARTPVYAVWGVAAALLLAVGLSVVLYRSEARHDGLNRRSFASAAKPTAGSAGKFEEREIQGGAADARVVAADAEKLQDKSKQSAVAEEAMALKEKMALQMPQSTPIVVPAAPAVAPVDAVSSPDSAAPALEAARDEAVSGRIAVPAPIGGLESKKDVTEQSAPATQREQVKDAEQPGMVPPENRKLESETDRFRLATATLTPADTSPAAAGVAFSDNKAMAQSRRAAGVAPEQKIAYDIPSGAASAAPALSAAAPVIPRSVAARSLAKTNSSPGDAGAAVRSNAPQAGAPASSNRVHFLRSAAAGGTSATLAAAGGSTSASIEILRERASALPSPDSADAQLRLAELLFEDPSFHEQSANELRKCLGPGLSQYFSQEALQDIRAKLATLASDGTTTNPALQ
jgi:hypothetical protein